MKKFLFILFLFYSKLIFAQVPNLTGRWFGTTQHLSGKSFVFNLDIYLIDSCGPVYKVVQYDGDDKETCSYNIVQSKNILVRDAISFWQAEKATPAHLTLKIQGNTIVGNRLNHNEDNSLENIVLKKSTPITYFQPCFPPKIITKYYQGSVNKNKKSEPCENMKPIALPDHVFQVKDSAVVMVYIKDNIGSDSDRVTIFFNNDKILNNSILYSDVSYILPIKIVKNSTITWCACNQGFSGNNTGELVLQEYHNSALTNTKKLSINLKKNERASIMIYLEK